ncbi:MAG: DUF4360 domain-containing protein [Bdellovibrionota bacterium]
MKRSLVFIAITVLGLQANASRAVEAVLDLRGAGVGGNGCVGGAALIDLSPNDILQIRTPELVNDSARSPQIERKACAVSIPFQLPRNMKLVVSAGRVQTTLSLKAGAVARTNAELFTAGTRGPTINSVDNGPKKQVSLLKIAGLETGCGASGILRLNLNQALIAKAARSRSSIDGAKLSLRLAACR